MSYTRFAVYYLPPRGALADFGAEWLGWDARRGQAVAQPDLPGLGDITVTAAKYGFHGTLKPPFRLAPGCSRADLEQATARLADSTAPASSGGLVVAPLGRFMALVPQGDTAGIARVAATCVAQLDAFRAPLEDDEMARRRKAGLSPAQEALLVRWGYPYVMEAFRFHLTLTGRLPRTQIDMWSEVIASRLPPLPDAFVLDRIALMGERPDGRFEMIHAFALSG